MILCTFCHGIGKLSNNLPIDVGNSGTAVNPTQQPSISCLNCQGNGFMTSPGT